VFAPDCAQGHSFFVVSLSCRRDDGGCYPLEERLERIEERLKNLEENHNMLAEHLAREMLGITEEITALQQELRKLNAGH
jgi:hypothetical protein